MTYRKIRSAAEQRQSGESTGAWALADALVSEVPEQQRGGSPETRKGRDAVPLLIANISARLAADGIETPSGGLYTDDSLRVIRLVAIGWPEETRQPLAAFRTHQEAGTTSEWKREVLRALCLAVENRDYTMPPTNHGTLDPSSWALAVGSVQRKVSCAMRYPVSANDLRTALQMKANVPSKESDAEKANVLDAIESMQVANDKMAFGVRVLTREGMQLGDQREALVGLIARLQASVDMLGSLLREGGVTDAALEAFMAEDPR